MDFLAAAEDLAGQIRSDDIRAYVDPTDALNNRPCVLVESMPDLGAMTMGGGVQVTWPLRLLSSYEAGAGDIPAVAELQPLISAVDAAIGVEGGRKITWQLTRDAIRIAAYELTVSDFLAF